MFQFKYLLPFILLINCSFFLVAQDHSDRCGHLKATEKLYDTCPEARPENNTSPQRLTQAINDYKQNSYNIAQAPILTIPTVVHVVHNNGPENLTDFRRILFVKFKQMTPPKGCRFFADISNITTSMNN